MSEFTVYDVTRLKSVTAVAISPEDDRIAYLLSIPRNPFEEDDGTAWSELHVVDSDGNNRPFVTGKVELSVVQWKPDGSAISFIAKRGDDEHKCLYSIPIDGGEAQRIVTHDEDISGYCWAPDGNRIAFLAKPKQVEETEELSKKGFNQEVYEEDWRHVRIWIAELNDAESEPESLDIEGSASEVHWSPDGASLVFALAPTPLIDDQYMSRDIKILDLETGEVVNTIQIPGKLGKIAWSPNSQSIAFIAGADEHDSTAGCLMVASVNESTFENILPDYEGHVIDLSWHDIDSIYFLGAEGVQTTFNTIRRNGSGRKILIEANGPILHGFSSENKDNVAFFGDEPKHPGEAYLYTGEHGLRQLTNHNPWLKERDFGEQEVVTWTARDGLQLEGILIKPVNYDSSKKYPLILRVHGGPESHDTNGWLTSYSNPGQVGASQGFAVFYPNYRGSTGRGVEFSKLSYGDPAGSEFDDLADAVDHFIDNGLADPDRVGITGGSYGGYASAWGATYYSEKFAASVMFVGISDKLSKMGTSDIPVELYQVHDPHWPWEDWKHLLEASPVFHLEKARTPILIMGGKDDPRVHPSQSLELYRFLKIRNEVPVRLVQYPGEGHGNTRAASRLDYSLRLMRWMNHFLKEGHTELPDYELEYNKEALKQ